MSQRNPGRRGMYGDDGDGGSGDGGGETDDTTDTSTDDGGSVGGPSTGGVVIDDGGRAPADSGDSGTTTDTPDTGGTTSPVRGGSQQRQGMSSVATTDGTQSGGGEPAGYSGDPNPTGGIGDDVPLRALDDAVDLRQQASGQWEGAVGPEDIMVTFDEGDQQLEAELTESGVRELGARDTQYDYGDIAVEEEDGQFVTTVDESARREQAREQIAEQIDNAGPDDITVEQTGEGGYELATFSDPDSIAGAQQEFQEFSELDDTVVSGDQATQTDSFGQTTRTNLQPGDLDQPGFGEVVVDVAQRTVDDPVGYVGGGAADFATETQFVDVDDSMRSDNLDADIADRLPGAAGDAAGYIGRSIDEGVRQFDQAAEFWDESVASGAQQYEQAGVPAPVAGFVEDTGRIINPAGAAADTVRATEAGTYVALGVVGGADEFVSRAGEATDHAAYYGGTAVEAAQDDPSIIPAAIAGGAALGLGATGAVRATRASARSVRAGRVPGRTVPDRARSGFERARSGTADLASRTRTAAGEARARSPVGVEIDPDAGLVEVSDDLTANAAASVRQAGGQARSAAGRAASRTRSALDVEPETGADGSSLTSAVAGRVRRSGPEEDAALLGAPRTSFSDQFVGGIEGRVREAARASIRRRQRDLGELRRNQDPIEPYEPLQGSARIGSRDWASIPREAAGAVRSAAPSPIRATRAELRSARFRGSEVEESGWFREMDAPPTATGAVRSLAPSRQPLGNLQHVTIRIGSRSDADAPDYPDTDFVPDSALGTAADSRRQIDTDTTDTPDRPDADAGVDGQQSLQQVARAEEQGVPAGAGTEFDLRGPLASGVFAFDDAERSAASDEVQLTTATQPQLETTQSPTLDASAGMESEEYRDLAGTASFSTVAPAPVERQPTGTRTSTRTRMGMAQRAGQRLQEEQRTSKRVRPRFLSLPDPDVGGGEDEWAVSTETDSDAWETGIAPPSALFDSGAGGVEDFGLDYERTDRWL